MTPADKATFLTTIGQMYGFYGKTMSDFDGSIWWMAMQPYELAAVSDAIMRQMVNPDNGQFRPMPADIVRMLGGTTKDRASLAWTRVDFAVRTAGPWASVAFESRHIHIVIAEMGGWVKLCESSSKDYPFVENDFVARYRAAIMRSDVTHPSHLPGISETNNMLAGKPVAPPIAIGDAQRCTVVYRAGLGCPEDERPSLLAYTAVPPALRLVQDRPAKKSTTKKIG